MVFKKPTKADIILERMDNDFEKWTNENARKKMHKFANNYFTSNVINPLIQKDPRNWHKCLKQFSKYKSRGVILNLINGPIANLHQCKKA